MTEVTIITGIHGEEAKVRALELSFDKKTFNTTWRKIVENQYPFEEMDLDTEFIIIDENWAFRFYEFVDIFSSKETLRIDRKNSKTIFIKMPKIIFCINKIPKSHD